MMMNSNKYCVFVCTKQLTPVGVGGASAVAEAALFANRPNGCCGSVGAIDIYHAFQAEITARQLTDRIEVRQSGCLNHCAAGAVVLVYRPNLVDLRWLPTKLRLKIRRKFFPSRYLYGHLNLTDISTIVDRHFVNGKPLTRCQISEDRI